MEKYILELIKENNRVIIPNFGAFIISKENGISILFNNFLSFNDGLLVNYVAEKKGIDTIVATDQVFDFVDSLKKELDEKGIYNIDKLGVFKKDDNGILRFQQASDFGDFTESISDNTEVKETNTEKEEDVEVYQDSTLLDIDNSSEIIDTPEDEKSKEEENIDLKKDAEPILTIDKEEPKKENIEKSASFTKTIPSSNKETITPESKFKSTSSNTTSNSTKYTQKVKKENKRKDIITFVIIALLVVLCVAVYFVFFNKKKEVVKPTPIKVEKPIQTEPVQKDSTDIEKKEIKAKPEDAKVEPKPLETHTNDFYIIVGSFKQQDNATKMVEKLKASGFTNAQIITKGNMFLVSADSNPSYRVIEARQQEILENDRMESWLYKIQ